MEERVAGMAMAGIMPIKMPILRDEWSRTLESMSNVFSTVMQLLRNACSAMSMMWPTRLQKEVLAAVRSSFDSR
jgi:hypothetical protein